MDEKTADALCALTNDFYRNQCRSFSDTRRSPWHGWHACLEVLRDAGFSGETHPLCVLDLACGNLRFEAFLEQELPQADLKFFAVDDCDDLVPDLANVRYQSLDIMATLRKGGSLSEYLEAPVCDIAVAFGFMHHVPGVCRREAVLRGLLDQTRAGGFVIVSFWQFLNDEKLAAKAAVAHARGLRELGLPSLDENDFLLGWQEVQGAYRYCHSFSDDEIAALLASVAGDAHVVARFSADGKAGNLNSYAVLQKRGD